MAVQRRAEAEAQKQQAQPRLQAGDKEIKAKEMGVMGGKKH